MDFWVFIFLFIDFLLQKKIGYKYFFVFADFTFMIIGGMAFILHYIQI